MRFLKGGLSTLVILKIVLFITMFVSRYTYLSYLKKYPDRILALPAYAPCPTTTTCRWPPATWPPLTADNYRSGPHWSYSGIRGNILAKIINGNRRLGYNLSMWNCRRGLISGDKDATTKLVKVQEFLENIKLHMLCLVESDLHSDVM